MDLARAPRRARLTARKKGSGYENGESPGLGRSRDDKKWQYLTATRQGVARYSLMKYTSLRNKSVNSQKTSQSILFMCRAKFGTNQLKSLKTLSMFSKIYRYF